MRSVTIEDFQSLAEVSVEFGQFTVLTGRSNTGKSAFLRAIRGCLRNQVSPGQVRLGQSYALIRVDLDDHVAIETERGRSRSTYRVRTDTDVQTYTKAGRAVPEDVLRAISMPLLEGNDANFSFQFDRPFLLAESGSVAAAVLGSLTNVTALHTLVREANRRRLTASQQLSQRRTDLAAAEDRAKTLTQLTSRRDALARAQTLHDQAQEATQRLSSLRRVVLAIRDTTEALDSLTANAPADVHEPIERGSELNRRLRALEELTAAIRTHANTLRDLTAVAHNQARERDQAAAAREAHLKELGVCPTCGTTL